MSGTNYANRGFRRITRLGPPVKVRMLGFMLVIGCGGLLMTWLTRSTLQQLDRLQKEHAAVRSESFYLAVTLRSSIRGLNDKLLQVGRSRDPNIAKEFFDESADLQRWLAQGQSQLAELGKLPLLKQVLVDDFDILTNIQTQYRAYLKEANLLLEPTHALPGEGSFQGRYDQVRRASGGLLRLCDDLVRAQREDFTDFLAETQTNLVSHQRLLKLTLTLILALAGALAVLVYRGMIAPLRLGLTQSNTIIERQEKLASLGVLASGVAHEIRNPLTAIKFRLFSLKKSVPALANNEDASIISDELNRLERIVKDFLRFARPSEPELATLEGERLLREVQQLLQAQLERAGIQLRVEVQDAASVHADAHQLKQVLINLVQNAAEAIGRNGLVTLSLRQDTAELDGREKPAAILAVADNGKGILPTVEARLFDPFFSTKEGGTGLGLAIAARIVEKHGGMLRYETEVNRGTTFEIVLPRVEHESVETPAHRG
jgi:signal transduction histidine kinase